uniref:DNA-directed RNA polymerase subunit beta' n=1 Tax=Nitella hyalina TaxID=181804 RepID=A0A2H4G3F7_NITHY|nr:RNA polymerase beta' subunit [Nitella hyalina]
MIHQKGYQFLQIGLASPKQIRKWAERILPNGDIVGEVKEPHTLHYRNQKPEKDGLFCEKNFGPTKSGRCACGKYERIPEEKEGQKFCKKCWVEFTYSRVRRYRMGYIRLGCSVTHVWYLKSTPSHIANLLGQKLKDIESLAYYNNCLGNPTTSYPTLLFIKKYFQYSSIAWLLHILLCFFSFKGFEALEDREIGTGGDAIKRLLSELDLQNIIDQSRRACEELTYFDPLDEKEAQKAQREKERLVRRIKIASYFQQTNIKPQWMVLSIIPVLPPDLRPMIHLNDGPLATSDLNDLYRKVLYRNKTLWELKQGVWPAPHSLMISQKRLVQEAVDALIDNGLGGPPMKDSNNRPYKSLSDVISGKQGRFRQNLLGKRVDYSGRSVIVVGPNLKIYQCGLPKIMAIELFQPFLINYMISNELASNLRVAKSIIQSKHPIIHFILKKVIQKHPVLLNRAPTLHRLGIQAFQPILVEGKAILLHPLVCTGFNADFDGDQMAVHIPLSIESQAEANLIMLSYVNLLSPATGDPITLPSQDMLLGLYMLTLEDFQRNFNFYKTFLFKKFNFFKIPSFLTFEDVIKARTEKKIHIYSLLWFKLKNIEAITSHLQQLPIEIQYNSIGTKYGTYEDWNICQNNQGECVTIYSCTTVGRVIFNQKLKCGLQQSTF